MASFDFIHGIISTEGSPFVTGSAASGAFGTYAGLSGVVSASGIKVDTNAGTGVKLYFLNGLIVSSSA